MWRRIRGIVSQLLLSSTFISCNSGDGGFLPSPGGNATLRIDVTDAPADSATGVVLEFVQVELTREFGSPVVYDLSPARSIEMLALRGGATATVIEARDVPEDDYVAIRLFINAQDVTQGGSFIDLNDGRRFPLVIPNNPDGTVAFDVAFSLREDDPLNLVVDFDLRKSITGASASGASFLLEPVARLVDPDATGTLAGTVSPDLVPVQCTPFVYVFSGAGQLPDDMDLTINNDPLVSVPATFDNGAAVYRYRAAFLPAGEYTVSFTCDGAVDGPVSDETLVFSRTVNSAISANQTTTVNFTL